MNFRLPVSILATLGALAAQTISPKPAQPAPPPAGVKQEGGHFIQVH